jgi:hypothetical protein
MHQALGKKEGVVHLKGGSDISKHSFSGREKKAYTDFVNDTLKGDEDLGGALPINPLTDQIFEIISKGVLLG